MSQTNEFLVDISEKLDKVLKLLALSVVNGFETELDKIELLDSIGFRPIEIVKFLNKSQDNVNNRLNEIRKKKEATSRKSDVENAKKSGVQQAKPKVSA